MDDLDPSDLRDITLQLEHLRRFTDAAEAHLLAELDDRRVTDLLSGLTTSKWLADRARLPVGVARQRLVVAKKLAAMLPTVDEALSAGRIGFDHARVFADVVNDRNHAAMEPLLDDLIAASAGTVFNRWRDDVTALAALPGPRRRTTTPPTTSPATGSPCHRRTTSCCCAASSPANGP